ncbi:MBL fold metallo-hydrolase [Embleya sp. NPDC050493]|uniref:MBL fold metallo-hydrolase n=1 Tax=Embleya sp. NPDC050493 TaxID=3363989 RepID=UPI0037A241D1
MEPSSNDPASADPTNDPTNDATNGPRADAGSAGRSAPPDLRDAPPPVVRGEPVEIRPGVFVIPDNRVPLVPNIGIVVGERAALVVDTGLGPGNGAHVLDHARRLAGDRPLYLTTTHFHPEHGFGAQAFKGAATIVYNRSQRDELRRKGTAYAGMFAGMSAQIAAALEGVEFVDPDVVYADHAEIDLGGHTAVLSSRGPAHTASDQTVLIDGRVLFTGDLVETRMFPILPYFPPFDTDVDGSGWIALLDRLLADEPEIVVPGHGEVAEAGLIGEVRGYLDHVRAETRRLRAGGASADDTAAAIDRDARVRWATWDNPEWIGFAARAFHHADPHGADSKG